MDLKVRLVEFFVTTLLDINATIYFFILSTTYLNIPKFVAY